MLPVRVHSLVIFQIVCVCDAELIHSHLLDSVLDRNLQGLVRDIWSLLDSVTLNFSLILDLSAPLIWQS